MLRLKSVVVSLVAASALVAQPILIPRIVTIGDSITEGDTYTDILHASYRAPLWDIFRTNRHCVDMVGTKRGVAGGIAGRVFDQDTFSFSGETSSLVRARLSAAAGQFNADFALIHIGSADVIIGMPGTAPATIAAGVMNNLRAMINTLLSPSFNPQMKIFVAKLIPLPVSGGVNYDLGIQAINARIPGLAGPNVVIVDQYSGFSTATHTYDGVHPNALGESFLATNWYQKLTPNLPTSTACFQDYGSGASIAPIIPTLTYGSPMLPTAGATISVNLAGLTPSVLNFGVVSLQPAVVPLPNGPAFQFVDLTPGNAVAFVWTTPPATWSLAMPSGPGVVGGEFFIQAFTVDASLMPQSVTNAGYIRIG